MTSTAPAHTSSSRSLQRLRAVIVLVLVLPAAAYVAAAIYLYRDGLAQARLDLDRTTRIAQEHALKLFDTNEMLLQRMLDLVGATRNEELHDREAELHERLKRMTADLPQVQGLYVMGANARLVASDRVFPAPREIDYSDREWFKSHRDALVPVFVTEQLRSRTTREPFFDMSRRRSLPGGGFAGVVNVSLRPEYLTDFWRELTASEPGQSVAVVREDGRLVALWPSNPALNTLPNLPADDLLMQQTRRGSVTGAADGLSQLDGSLRMRMFRKLGRYPLYVVASVDDAVVIAEWRRQIGLLAILVFAASGGLAWLAWLSMVRTRDELDAVARLDEERAQRQQIEIALLQSQKLEAMGRLTGGVAHDFNNLLMVINSNLYMHRRLQPQLAESVQLAAIGRAVTAGSKLTRQLLAFARKQALLPERLLLQERLPVLMDLLRPLLGSTIEVSCAVAAETKPIEVDAAELELALINLAVNARDAIQGSGRLTFSAYNTGAPDAEGTSDADYVVIDAHDSGPGIDSTVAERAFEPFFTTKAVGQGTGLGLSQVKALCQSAGGFARIENAPGGGALVRLFLRPSAEAPSARPPLPAVREDLNCHVLLVEDNSAVAQATQELLQSMGCRVTHASSGHAALDYLKSRADQPELVLSDIEMPGAIDGIALATLLTEQKPGLPILLLTGYATRLEQAVKARFEVLPKPCPPELLGEAIGNAIAKRKAASSEDASA